MARKIINDDTQIREAVGIFTDVKSLYNCIDELQMNGFDRSDITMLDHPHLKKVAVLRQGINTQAAEDNPSAKRGAFVDPESIGDAEGALVAIPLYVFTLAGTGISAALGASTSIIVSVAALCGLLGAVLGGGAAYWLKRRKDAYYDEQVRHGGIPVWIHLKDAAHEKQALKTLRANNAEDIHVHDLTSTPYEVREGRSTVYHIIH
ncbi:hypothetical protein [Sneathiella chinensis]|uniref:Uncharacterized protein n=1 Tax=Sneathiella chinensis TaxID=349750 RepID=A0ABQ5U2G0_9PROT|nr:hypothetical protein [Sneathiella chinensis]GLQ06089.1 hypothetical protein GCM10007924_13100 [Sneathiella chinensis]